MLWERNYFETDEIDQTVIQTNYQQSNLPHITSLLVQYVTRKTSIQDVATNHSTTVVTTSDPDETETLNVLNELIHPNPLKRHSSEYDDDDDEEEPDDVNQSYCKRQRSDTSFIMNDIDHNQNNSIPDEQQLSAIRMMSLFDNNNNE